jgi:hypothetical protein
VWHSVVASVSEPDFRPLHRIGTECCVSTFPATELTQTILIRLRWICQRAGHSDQRAGCGHGRPAAGLRRRPRQPRAQVRLPLIACVAPDRSPHRNPRVTLTLLGARFAPPALLRGSSFVLL